jgi:hypothetical protein
MAKRPGALDAMQTAIAATRKPADHATASNARRRRGYSTVQQPAPAAREFLTTAVRIPVDQWERLRKIAAKRVEGTRARPSVSGLLVELLDTHLDELDK